jgi:hypothetical protein
MTDPLAAVGTHLPPEDGVTLTGPREYGPGDNTWLRPLVARYLQDIWGVSRLVPDSVGEYRYRVGGAECWVSVHDFMKPATVEVFATAATRVTPSATLLPAINDLNAGDEIATIYWSGGSVMVKYSIFGATVDRDQLRHVCAAVGKTADHVGTLMASECGGITPFRRPSQSGGRRVAVKAAPASHAARRHGLSARWSDQTLILQPTIGAA